MILHPRSHTGAGDQAENWKTGNDQEERKSQSQLQHLISKRRMSEASTLPPASEALLFKPKRTEIAPENSVAEERHSARTLRHFSLFLGLKVSNSALVLKTKSGSQC